jgi:hypothetical protein
MIFPINDPTLVEVKSLRGPGIFLAATVATVASLTIAWGTVVEGFVRFKIPFSFTTAESNIADLVKGVRTPNPDIAILGSSLAKRLDPGLFTNSNLINLSVGGGSVMTGLEVLSSSTLLPKVILIEINILDRPLDEELANTAKAAAKSQTWAILSGLTKPIRYLMTKPLFSYIPPKQLSAWWNNQRISLLSKTVATYDIQSVVSSGVAAWNRRNNWEIADKNFRRIEELIPEFEARGAKVYLLYLPYADGYDDHAFARRNRKIASGNEAFNCQRCIDVRQLVDVDVLRWADGAHLDDRSAAIVAVALQRRLSPEQYVPAEVQNRIRYSAVPARKG